MILELFPAGQGYSPCLAGVQKFLSVWSKGWGEMESGDLSLSREWVESLVTSLF